MLIPLLSDLPSRSDKSTSLSGQGSEACECLTRLQRDLNFASAASRRRNDGGSVVWSFRALAVSAAFLLAVVVAGASPAQAIARYSALAVANDTAHAVGDSWQEILPDGEAMTVQKIAPGVSMGRTPVRLS